MKTTLFLLLAALVAFVSGSARIASSTRLLFGASFSQSHGTKAQVYPTKIRIWNNHTTALVLLKSNRLVIFNSGDIFCFVIRDGQELPGNVELETGDQVAIEIGRELGSKDIKKHKDELLLGTKVKCNYPGRGGTRDILVVPVVAEPNSSE